MGQGLFDEAFIYFETSVRKDMGHKEAIWNLSQCASKLGHHQVSLDLLQILLTQVKELPTKQFTISRILDSLVKECILAGFYQQALTYIDELFSYNQLRKGKKFRLLPIPHTSKTSPFPPLPWIMGKGYSNFQRFALEKSKRCRGSHIQS